MIGIRQT